MQAVTESKAVWDIAIRIFHWSLVASFTIAYLSSDEESLLHVYAGYIVLALVLFRILWGFIGSRHARFSDFIYRPAQIKAYARGMMRGKVGDHGDGHNPLGGLMVLALLLSLSFTTVTGLEVYGQKGHGPLAQADSSYFIATAHASHSKEKAAYNDQGNKAAEHFWKEIHEFFANVTVFLVVLHIAGVLVSSILERQNLVRAMISGRKQHSRQQ